jgi:hypothetical protein
MDDYFKDLGMIYENLDLESSYDDYDAQLEEVKAKAHKICSALEHKLQGTIAHYKMNKDKFFKNPRDMNSFEALENMLKHLREPLYPYQEFRN